MYDKPILMNPNVPQEVRIINAISEQLFNSWPVSIIMIDLEDCIWRLNQQVMNELQLNEHVIGRHITDLLEVVCDKKNVLEALLLQLRERDVRIIPLDTNCFIRELKSGISFLIQGAMVGIHEDGQLVRIVLYFRNVLEERTQKHLLNIALSRTQIFQWSFDMEHNLMIIEPRYFEYLGIPTRDYTLTPEEFAFLIHPDDRKGVFNALALQLRGNLYERPVEYRLRRGDGKWEWFEAQSTYVGQLTDLPFRIIGICMSTQKYKDTENKLNEALQKAQRSDELKSVFLANMSHEIRTPLNAIVGFSSLLTATENETERKEFISIIETNNQLLLQLVSDILDLSKIEANTLEFNYQNVDLNQLAKDVENTVRGRLQTGVALQFVPEVPVCYVQTEHNRLSQVLINLLVNAAKFTEKGEIMFGYKIRGEELYFYVKDTGIGISLENQKKIFERFTKVNTFIQGTGLGLSICKNIVTKMKGRIGVESEGEGKGSTFWFTIPYKPKEAQKENNLTLMPLLNERSKEKPIILIAEDNESNYMLFKSILQKDYELVHAWDGEEAVVLHQKFHPHVVIMDINMPKMDGYEATREIRKVSKTVPIIAVTAYSFASDKEKIMQNGFNGYMSKPVDIQRLKEKLDYTIHGNFMMM